MMVRMDHGEFSPSFGDAGYRRFVKEAVDRTEAGIKIAGSDLACINYPEVLHSIREARKGGVAVSVYFTNAPKRIVSWLRDHDVQLYQGKKMPADEEYIIRDGSRAVASRFQDSSRTGYWTTEGSQVREFSKIYDSLLSDPETRVIAEMRARTRKRRVKISEAPQEEIMERMERNERLAREIGMSTRPEQLADLEASIRRSRERAL